MNKKRSFYKEILLFFYIAAAAMPVNAQTSIASVSGLGPGSVPVQLKEAQDVREYDDPFWPEFSSLENIGLSIATDYTLLTQQVNESLGEKSATGGVLRMFGNWKPNATDSNSYNQLVFKVEHRHRIGPDIAPNELLVEAGVAGVSGPTFSDKKALLTNLYWAQHLYDNKLGYFAGVVDVSDYIDVYALVNVWTEFNNLAFSTNPTIPAPSQGIGAAARWLFDSKVYVIASIADANGDPHNPSNSIDSFFSTGEYFKHIEVGIIDNWDERMSRNAHITFWQTDEREDAGTTKDWGVAASWSIQREQWQPFIRAGYADGGVALQKKMISGGIGYAMNNSKDYAGVALSWGQSTDSDRDQYITEGYYKWQGSKHILLVPSIQYIRNPAGNEDENSIFLVSLKCRITF